MNPETLRKAAMLHPTAIPEPFNAIMEQYGFDAVYAIADILGGTSLYIPQKHRLFMRCLEKEAAKDYNSGANYHTLTRKYGISERHLRRIFNEK
jgi:Mor family transcriptional regulator